MAYIFAARHPQYVSKLILIDCGPFDVSYFPQLVAARSIKTMPLKQKEDMIAAGLYTENMQYDPDHYCLLPDSQRDMLAFHEEQFKSLMDEIIPMRASGELLNLSQEIQCGVVALHGRNDPHPWEEYYARDEFFAILKREIGV